MTVTLSSLPDKRFRERERESLRLVELHGFVFTTSYPIFSALKSFLEATGAL